MLFSKINRLLLLVLLISWSVFSQKYPGKVYNASNVLPNNTIRSLFVDSTNTLWIGTDNGIVSKKNGVFESYFEEDGLALNSCWAISEDIFQNMWFGSYGAGISIYNGTEFRIISENDGLVHNEITKLFPYGDFMYVGTSDGVSRINIKNYKVSSWDYSETDDLFRVSGFF